MNTKKTENQPPAITVDVWQYLQRAKGQFMLGDTVWNRHGRSFLIMRRNELSIGIISVNRAKQMYNAGELTHIADNDDIVRSFDEQIIVSEEE